MEKSKLNEKNSYVSEKYPLESEQPMTTNPINKEKKCTKKKKIIIIISILVILIITIIIIPILMKLNCCITPILPEETAEFTTIEKNEEVVID